MGLADLAVRLSWVASCLADFKEGWVVWKSGDGHGAHEAEGEGGEGRELHFVVLGARKFGFL